MMLSISCRIAEGFLSKEQASLSFEELADLAVACGYDAICMRASQFGIDTPLSERTAARRVLEQRQLRVSMVTGNFDIVYNNARGPDCLRNIVPHLELAAAFDAPFVRVCLKRADDIDAARRAADEAAARGITLVHQCHTLSLFETVDGITETLERIDHPHFGLIFEAANLEACRQDYGIPTIERLAPWIRNVYLQNQVLKEDGSVTLDTWCCGPISFDVVPVHTVGGIDFSTVLTGLHRVGYEGPLTVHQSGPEDGRTTALESARETASYLRNLWARTGSEQ